MVSETDMSPGEIISYLEMCRAEGVNLQRGMNFHLRDGVSVILMSTRPGAPYSDRIEQEGRVLIYEGHDLPRIQGGPDPKSVDQPLATPFGTPTENGKFLRAALDAQSGGAPELVRVYGKIRSGVWVYLGVFSLIDGWSEESGGRKVFKFRLEAAPDIQTALSTQLNAPTHTRAIPPNVVQAVWKRDRGRCIKCGATTNLHLDHIIPFSKGGSSLTADNIQLLCMSHNLEKRDTVGY